MTPAIALGITVVAAIAYTAASVWAARQQEKWMAEARNELTRMKNELVEMENKVADMISNGEL